VARYPRAGRKTDEHRLNHQTHSKGFEDSGENLKDVQRDLNPSPVVVLPDVVRRPARAGEGEKNGLTRLPPFAEVVKSVPS
jgi:hypothetical protein